MLFSVGYLKDSDKYLADLPKRIQGLSNDSSFFNSKDPLWILWRNMLTILPVEKTEEYYIEVLHILAYMAFKIEEYSVNNMLKDSPTVHKILYEMKSYIFLDLNYFKR